jgi:phage/plasmid-associated DNA primase
MFLFSNMGLALPDQSGALAGRYVPLVLTKSFADVPDVGLTDTLMAELPAILEWSRVGLLRLEGRVDERGRKMGFQLTAAGKELLGDIVRQGSTVQAFIRECCVLDAGEHVPKSALFDAFVGWSRQFEVEAVYTREAFGRELNPATGFNVKTFRPRAGDQKVPGEQKRQVEHYRGIALKPEYVGWQWSIDIEDEEA